MSILTIITTTRYCYTPLCMSLKTRKPPRHHPPLLSITLYSLSPFDFPAMKRLPSLDTTLTHSPRHPLSHSITTFRMKRNVTYTINITRLFFRTQNAYNKHRSFLSSLFFYNFFFDMAKGRHRAGVSRLVGWAGEIWKSGNLIGIREWDGANLGGLGWTGGLFGRRHGMGGIPNLNYYVIVWLVLWLE